MRFLSTLLIALLLSSCASFPLSEILTGERPLTEATVADGLREALRTGTSRATDRLSVTDAFAGVAARRIGIPDELAGIANRLRMLGLGAEVDDFELRMNRAAEAAVPRAVNIFAGAVRDMTIQDAFGILNGPPDAATVYFRDRTSTAIATAFRPDVEAVMQDTGVYRVYTRLIDRYNALPITDAPEVDLVGHIVASATGALFTELALEEARIREDPAARTTSLLQRVFSGQEQRVEGP